MILSIDASTKSSGIAILDSEKNLIYYDCLTASSTDLIKRIKKMTENISKIIKDYPQIEKIILEEVRPDTNIYNLKTYKALMYLQGAIVTMVHDEQPNIKIEYIYPSEWRKECNIKQGAGVRRTTLKQQDINFIKEKYSIEVNDDIADSIAIGYAYLNKRNKEEGYNWA